MTATEKASEIFMKFAPDLLSISGMDDETFEINRKFALIVVDEILLTIFTHKNSYDYWQEVKQEIEKL
jgi:hypothetical protein